MSKKKLDKTIEKIERVLPMTLNSLILFLVVAYLLFVVGRSVWINYQSRKDIALQKIEIEKLKKDIDYLNFQIAYFQTNTFKEKEARAKLGYKAPGENVISLVTGDQSDKIADQGQADRTINTPNQILWWKYFFEE